MLLYRSAVMLLFQSTLPREERLFRQLTITDRRKIISIHAPTRGATYLELANEILGVFQSTLPREERRCMRVRIAAPLCNFNPRSHERSDGDVNKIDCGGSVISIHAPTRGATLMA